MSEHIDTDLLVIGAGSGGLSAAAGAVQMGARVVLLEGGRMGGDCLNYGCVPSKALLASGKRAHAMTAGTPFGIGTAEPRVDFAAVKDHVAEVIAGIAPHDSVERFEALGVRVIPEYGRFIAWDTVDAGATRITARRIVLATGSRPFVPPIPGLDEVPHYTNETIFELRERPEHLLIIGGGPIGMEMAQAHRRLGSDVTVIEGLKALGKDDPELTTLVLDRLRGEGIAIHEEAKVAGVSRGEGSSLVVRYETSGGEAEVTGSHVLVATGRKPNLDRLDLDKAGVKHDRKGIKVNRALLTSNRKIYAIGDVAGGLQFTHVAGYHAALVVQSILFRFPGKENRDIIPWATYTDPELAHVGLDEKEARKCHRTIRVLRWPYAENDRAQAERKTDGMVKVITDRKGRILGADIVGAGAGEMINLFALAVAKKMKVSDIRAYVPPYPTMTEMAKRAATSFSAPVTRKPAVRRLIAFLRSFG